MTEKIKIEPIPITDDRVPIRRIIQPRGELAIIEDERSFRHLTYFSLKCGKGFFRGGHFHKEKLEHLYVIEGRMIISFVDMDSGESASLEATAGCGITIFPRCAHRFDALEDTRVIEYFDSVHDPRDDCPFDALRGL